MAFYPIRGYAFLTSASAIPSPKGPLKGSAGRAGFLRAQNLSRAFLPLILSPVFVLGFVEPCLAASAGTPASGPSWAVAGGLAFAAALAAFLAGRGGGRGKAADIPGIQVPPPQPEAAPAPNPVEADPGAEKDDFLTEAQHLARVGFFRCSLESGTVEAAPFLLELFGFAPDESFSLPDIESRIHPDDRSAVKVLAEKALGGNGEVWEPRCRISPGSRVVRQVSARIRIVRDAEGRAVRLFGLVQDLTEREEMESRLRISQELFRQYMENAPSAVIMASAQGRIKDVSPSAERLFRTPREQMLNSTLLDLFPGYFVDEGRKKLRELVNRGHLSTEVPFRTGEGQVGWGRWDAVSLSQGAFMVFLTDMTQEHETQEALLHSEEAFKRLAENLPTLIFRVNEDYRMVYLNPATERFFGKTMEELQCMTLPESGLPRDFIRQWMDPLGEVFRTGQGHRFEVTLDTGAMVRYLQTALVPEKADLGIVRSVLAVSTDITDIKRQETRTQQQRDFLDALIRNAGEGIAVFDSTGRFVVFNPAMEAMTGWKLEELQPPAISYSFSRGEGSAAAMAGILKALEGVDSEEERLLPCRGDVVKTVTVTSSPLAGNPEALTLVIVRDVTEQKRATEALARERAYLDMLFDNAPDGMAVTDRSGEILRVNRRFSEMFGFARHEALGNQIDTLVARGAYAREGMTMTRQVASGRAVNVETERFRKDGTAFPCRAIGIPIRLEGGDVHIYALYHDLTEIRQREAELRLANEVVKSSPVILFRWGNELGSPIDYVSENVRLWGYEPEELVAGRSLYADLIHPEDREGTLQEVRDFTAVERDEFQQEYRIVMKNGEVIWVNDQTRIIREVDGNIAFYQGVVLDITEKKHFELLLEENYRTMRRAWDETIEVLSTTVEMRDPYTAGHQRRVARLAGAIARKLGVPEQSLFAVERASLLHDVGKIEVPAEILSKPGSLSAIEMGIVRQHVEAGWKILKNIALPWPLAEIVYQHHELLDGSGYPRGLRGEAICMEARIITVADIVEAMASHRPFRASRGLEAALAEIGEQKGKTLDERVVDACLDLFNKEGFELESF